MVGSGGRRRCYRGSRRSATVLMVSPKKLLLDVLEDVDVVPFTQRRLERKDNLTEIKVFALQRFNDGLKVVGLRLEPTGDEVVLVLEILDHVFELMEMPLLPVPECSLCCSVLFLAQGRTCCYWFPTGLLFLLWF